VDSAAIIDFGVSSPAQISLSAFATNVFVQPPSSSMLPAGPTGTTYARLETLGGTLVTNLFLPVLGVTNVSANLLLAGGGSYRFTYYSDVTSPNSGGIYSRVALQMKVDPAPPNPFIEAVQNPSGSPQIRVWGVNLGHYHIEYSSGLGAGNTWQRFQGFNATQAPYEFRFPTDSLGTSSAVFFRLREGD